MLDWRIYYQFKTLDNTQCSPEEADSYGVQCIVFPDEVVGRVIMHGWDWFYFNTVEKQWWGSDVHGLLDQLLSNQPITAIKQGRNISNKNFKEIFAKAKNDPDFPVKSATIKYERPKY